MDPASLELTAELGRGAMGVVYRARDPASGREVALKQLLAGSGERFLREGLVAARLDHPGIVRVHEAGLRAGRPCLVYELVEGARTLDRALEEASLEEAIGLLRDAARALGHAHARGIVHRDVKPENVLVDAHGRARVTDFGLAGGKELDRLTETGVVLGTPLYMAPETLTGERARVGPPTDVWALGAILYQALAGAPPFSADTLLTLTVQVVGTPVPPLPPGREAPPALLAVCRRALAKRPEERYPHADAFADELEAWLAGRPVQALLDEARRRRRRLLAAAAVALLVLGGGWGLGALLARPTGSPPAPAPVGSSAGPPVLTPAPTVDAGERWRAILRLDDPLERYLAACDWLEAHSGHALAGEAERMLEHLATAPLRRGELGRPARVLAAFGPEGTILAAGQDEGPVSCWDGDGRRWTREEGGRSGVLAVRDGVLGWSGEGVRLWRWSGGDPAGVSARSVARRGQPRYVAVAPDERRCAVALAGAELLLVGLARGTIERRIELPARAHALAFSPDGSLVAAGTGDNQGASLAIPGCAVGVWDAATGAQRGLHELSVGLPTALAFSPDGQALVVGLATGDVLRLDRAAGLELVFPSQDHEGPLPRTLPGGVKALAFDPRGERLFAVTNGESRRGDSTCLALLDPGSGAGLGRIPVDGDSETLTVSPDGRLLLRGTRAGSWELRAAPRRPGGGASGR